MKISNSSPKGKWIHVKINGYSYKKWLGGYASLVLPEVTELSQLNLNAHEEAVIIAEATTGVNPDPTPTPSFYYTVAATRLGTTGGTTSLSGASVSIAKGMNLSFSVHPESNYYLSAYTVNNVAQAMVTKSASTTYTISSIKQDKNITVAFAAYGS